MSRVWNPRFQGSGIANRKDYHAGYSDSYYDYHYGAGDENPGEWYKKGWEDAKEDCKETH